MKKNKQQHTNRVQSESSKKKEKEKAESIFGMSVQAQSLFTLSSDADGVMQTLMGGLVSLSFRISFVAGIDGGWIDAAHCSTPAVRKSREIKVSESRHEIQCYASKSSWMLR